MDVASSLSVIVAALDEEHDLEDAVRTVREAVARRFADWEVLIVNDGSRDGTGPIADALAARHPRVRAIHHPATRGLGACFKTGLAAARMDHVMLVNGKNDTPAEALDALFARIGEADLVIPYTLNTGERPLARRLLSRAFAGLLNALFRLHLRYYNHSVVYPRDLVRSVRIRTDSHAFQAEALVKLLKRGCSFVEVGVRDRFDPARRTRAFRPANVLGVASFLVMTPWDVYGPGAVNTPRTSPRGTGRA